MKLALIGNYGATNVGDDAILESILAQLKDHRVAVFSADPKRTAEAFGVRAEALFPLGFRSFLRGTFWRSFQSLRSADAVILGGGGLFQDDRLYACFLWAWQVFWIMLLKKPLFMWASGVGPLRSRWGKRLAAWAFRSASFVTVRDQASHDLLSQLGIPKEKIRRTADPVFSYSLPAAADRKKRWMLSVRPWLNHDPAILDAFSSTLSRITKENKIELVWVAMQRIRESDMQMIEALQRKLGGQILVPSSFSDLLQKMREAELAIGMRYHFLIAAMLTGTPCLPISYSPKVDELFKETPLWPLVIPVTELSAKRLEDSAQSLLDHSSKIAKQIEFHTGILRGKAGENARLFEEFLKTVDPQAIE